MHLYSLHMHIDKTGVNCKDLELFHIKTCFGVIWLYTWLPKNFLKTYSFLAVTNPHHQTTAAVRVQMRGVTPVNIMKPEKNFQNRQSSTSKQPTPRFLSPKKATAYLSRQPPNYQPSFQKHSRVPANLQLQTQDYQTKPHSHQQRILLGKNVPHSHQPQTPPQLLYVQQMILPIKRLSASHQKRTHSHRRSLLHHQALNPLLSKAQ